MLDSPLRKFLTLAAAGLLQACGEDSGTGSPHEPDSPQAARETEGRDHNPRGDPRSGAGVPDPAGSIPANASLWFTEEGESRGLSGINHCGSATDKRYLIEEIGQGCALVDIDGDGDLDAFIVDGCSLVPPGTEVDAPADQFPPRTDQDWLPAFDGRSRLYENDGSGHFRDITEAAGVGYRGMGFGATCGDFDGDGDADLYLTAWGPNRLYLNRGNDSGSPDQGAAPRFDDVSAKAGVDDGHWGVGSCVLDIDRDGQLDLYVANYLSMSTADQEDVWEKVLCPYFDLETACGPRTMFAQPDTLLHNRGGGVFEDWSTSSGIRSQEARYALGVVAFDFDLDGDTDLYVANDSRGNYLWDNDGVGNFEEYADFLGLALNANGVPQAGMGVACGDFDDDLDLDLFLTNFSHDDNTLYRNDGPTLFRDITRRMSFGENAYLSLGWGTDFADFDQDGLLDLFVANGHIFPEAEQRTELSYKQLNRLYQRNARGRFVDRSSDCGPGLQRRASSRGACFGDVDGDGDLDILCVELNERPSLLINQHPPNDGTFVLLSLEGEGGNRAAVGAQIEVEWDGHQRRIEQRIGASFASTHDARIHVGTGSAKTLDRLRVTWPDGTIQQFTNLETGTWYHIRKSTDTPEVRALR